MRFPVSHEKEDILNTRLASLGIREEDLIEKFIRASGPGGQKVNKTSSAVYLKHIPSGIEVRSQSDRSQGLNRYTVRKKLADELETIALGKRSAAEKEIFKKRKQKKRRSKKAREKILANKHHQSLKKRERTTCEE